MSEAERRPGGASSPASSAERHAGFVLFQTRHLDVRRKGEVENQRVPPEPAEIVQHDPESRGDMQKRRRWVTHEDAAGTIVFPFRVLLAGKAPAPPRERSPYPVKSASLLAWSWRDGDRVMRRVERKLTAPSGAQL